MIPGCHKTKGVWLAAVLALAGLILGPILATAQEDIPSPAEDATVSKAPEEPREELRALVQRFDRVLADMDEEIAALREQTAFGGSADLVELLDRTESMRGDLAAQRDEVISILERLSGGSDQ